MNPKIYVLLCSIVLLCVFLSAVWLFSKEEFDNVPAMEGDDKSQYILHQAEVVPRESIRSFAVDNEQIYVLYDNAALVNVYGTDGTYLYGIQFSTIKNGHSDIAIIGGKLFIESRRSIIFVFDGTQLVKTFDPKRNQDEYFAARTCFSTEKTTGTYGLSAFGNTVIDKNTQEVVLDLPQKLIVANSLTIAGLILFALFIRGYIFFFRKN